MTKQNKKTGRVKEVKAWAIISNEKIASIGRYYMPEMTLLSPAMAREMMKNGIYVIGKGYAPEIVPCTITYTLPTKKPKK